MKNNILENMVQNNEDIDKSFDAFFTAWLKHKNLSMHSLSGDEIIEEKKRCTL
ncbi:MAG: hypothetical protein QS748_09490 [Candidatus Endonucleobacter bathymodioli]|uniref:Uncharacterized protein n=1 Tax=Candidatus Endonucleibacter bathymodioli TaxID=539814 RepID=A0AA90SMZ1_9GAMM|nr:hypothetical protein [Candidatus Endonucleobacter bathymodioli]